MNIYLKILFIVLLSTQCTPDILEEENETFNIEGSWITEYVEYLDCSNEVDIEYYCDNFDNVDCPYNRYEIYQGILTNIYGNENIVGQFNYTYENNLLSYYDQDILIYTYKIDVINSNRFIIVEALTSPNGCHYNQSFKRLN